MSSKYFSDDTLEKIRRRLDIVDVVGQYVQLKKSGKNYTGLCPFHSEKTPSFSVSPEKQIYHCFGCGAGGDLFSFLMDIEGLSFREAVIQLGNEAGVEIQDINKYYSQDPKEKEKNKLIDIYEISAKLYHYLLLETEHGKEALEYLIKRGFTRELIETFNIGYSPSSWDTLTNFLQKRDYSEELLRQSGLIIFNDDGKVYDRFRNRAMFPITNSNGSVVAFGGRILEQGTPKYLNSPESSIFNKSRTLYNLSLAKKEIRKNRQAILFEGYVDTISSWKAGIYNGIASLGTSLTDDQAKILKKYADEIILAYDSDNAGHNATYKAIDILEKYQFNIKVLQLEQGLDPDDYINKYGLDAFKNEVTNSVVSSTSFKLNFIRQEYNLKDESDRIKYVTNSLQLISNLQHAIEREHYLIELANEFQYSLSSLKNDLNQILYEKRKKKEKTRDNLTPRWNNIINNGNSVDRKKKLLPAYYNAEKYLISLMLNNKQIAKKVEEEIGSEFHVEDFSVLAAYLYSFYSRGNEPNINSFITFLDDKKYIKMATELAMLDIYENVTEQEINDYIKQINNYNLDLEIKKLKEQQIIAERNKEFDESARIGLKIIQLRSKLKSKGN